MITHEPAITIKNGKCYLSSRFEMQDQIPNFPEELWFCFPEQYEAHLSDKSDAFAPAALLLAMYAGEDLIIRGETSARLAYNLYEYREVFFTWYPKLFRRVNLSFEKMVSSPKPTGNAVATAFSGGVDSFYTLWAHLPENQSIQQAQITHGLFIHGLDLHLEDVNNYHEAFNTYNHMFKELDLDLIQAETNAYKFSEFRIDWKVFHGVALIGTALCLSPLIRQFYVPSSFSSYNNLAPFGSTPVIDHLLSTENLGVVHHGASKQRVDKTMALASWEITHHKIRVCSSKTNINGLNNCGTCHKCYRTMVSLEILDALHLYNNFPGKMTPFAYLDWGLRTHLDPDTANELREKAKKCGKQKIAFGIQVALILFVLQSWSIKTIKKLFTKQQLYELKLRIYKPRSK